MLEVGNRAVNVYLLNYEVIRDHPEEVLSEIASLFDLKKQETFVPLTYYKGSRENGIYHKKRYERIPPLDLSYINSCLDKDLEKSIGYELILKSSDIK